MPRKKLTNRIDVRVSTPKISNTSRTYTIELEVSEDILKLPEVLAQAGAFPALSDTISSSLRTAILSTNDHAKSLINSLKPPTP